MLREAYRRVRDVVKRASADREVDAEMAFHLEMEAAKYERRGYSVEEARRLAGVAFGAADRFREESREARGISRVEATLRELRLSGRRLWRAPVFTLSVVTMLSLGFGIAAGVLTLVHGVLVRPLPYPEADRLVVAGHAAPGVGVRSAGQSAGTVTYYRERARSFEELGTYLENEVSITDGEAAERVHVAMVTPDVLALVVRRPALGRLFTDADTSENTILISHDLWQRRYGGDPAIIGRAIETNRTPRVVIGVLPRGFDFPRRETDLWYAWQVNGTRAGIHDLYMTGIGRLRRGVTAAEAERELAQLVPGLAEAYSDVTRVELQAAQLRPTVRLLHDEVTAEVRQPLVLLVVLLAAVLVIMWANVLNLVVLRAERQRREVAVARALGASVADLLRRFITEHLLLVGVAVVGGALVAVAAVTVRFGFGPGEIPRLHELEPNAALAVTLAALAMVTTLLLTVVAYARAAGAPPRDMLRAAFTHVTLSRGTQRAQGALVGVQVALAFVLLACAGAMLQSLWRLQRVELGFEPAQLVSFELNPPARLYLSYGRAAALHADVRDAIAALPGVEAVAASVALPLQPRVLTLSEAVAADGDATRAPAGALINIVTPGWFATLGVPLVAGRAFDASALRSESPGVVISAALARALFGDPDAVGRRVRLVAAPHYPAYTVVGVAGDVVGDRIASGGTPTLYLPAIFDRGLGPEYAAPIPYVPRELTVLVRTVHAPATLLPAVRGAMARVDAKIPIVGMQTLSAAVHRATARTRLVAVLLAIAAFAALFLGIAGLGGVVSYALARRAPELAIRLAIGAQPVQVARLMIVSGLQVATLGLAGGALAAVIVTRALAATLFEVDPAEPLMFLLIAALLLATALLACLAPARRAARLPPAAMLRAD